MVVSALSEDAADVASGTVLRREIMARPSSRVEAVTVAPGGEIGAHVHTGTDETIVVVAGDGEAELDGRRTPLRAGSLLFIPDGTPHNITNPGAQPLRLYAVQAGPS